MEQSIVYKKGERSMHTCINISIKYFSKLICQQWRTPVATNLNAVC